MTLTSTLADFEMLEFSSWQAAGNIAKIDLEGGLVSLELVFALAIPTRPLFSRKRRGELSYPSSVAPFTPLLPQHFTILHGVSPTLRKYRKLLDTSWK